MVGEMVTILLYVVTTAESSCVTVEVTAVVATVIVSVMVLVPWVVL